METYRGTKVEEYWGLKALVYFSDENWVAAEPGDERWFQKREAEMLLRHNPETFKMIGIWHYDGGSKWRKGEFTCP